LDEKRRSYERLLRLYRQISRSDTSSEISDDLATKLEERFDQAMRDDLNTPEAVAALFEITHQAAQEIAIRPEAVREFSALKETLEEVLTVLGFDLSEESACDVNGVRVRYEEEPDEGALLRVADREEARRKKDWATADRLRDELHNEGWSVEDTPEGPVVSRR
jgi:cysteinyl-tRNA synthetase